MFWSWFGACFDGDVDDIGADMEACFEAGMKACFEVHMSRLRVLHTGLFPGRSANHRWSIQIGRVRHLTSKK